MIGRLFLFFLVFCFLAMLPGEGFGQLQQLLGQQAKTKADNPDSAGPVAVIAGEIKQSDTSLGTLLTRLEEYTTRISRDQSFLKKGFDTTEISETLDEIQPLFLQWKNSIDKSANAGNIRNLNSISVAMHQLALYLNRKEDELNEYAQRLNKISQDLEYARNDSALRNIPRDSLLLENYLMKLDPLRVKWRQTDTLLQKQLKAIGLIQGRVATLNLEIAELQDNIRDKVDSYQRRFLQKDINPVWAENMLDNPKGYLQVVADGFKKNLGLSLLYLVSNGWPLILCLLICMGLFLLNRFNLRKIDINSNPRLKDKVHFVGRSNILSCVLIFFMISPFLLRNPPAGLVQIFWIFVTFTAIALRRPDWPEGYSRLAIIFLFFFCMFTLDSFILESNPTERYLLMVLNLGAAVFGWFFYTEVLKDKSRYHSLMDESILIFLVINVLAFLANITGRFNLARVLSNSSALSISLLLALQIIREIILESVYLHAETHRNTGFAGFLDYDGKNEKYRKFLGVLTIVLWILSFSWSLSFYDRIYDWVAAFLSKERSLGEFNYSFSSILIFIAVIWVAVVVERIVNLVFKTEATDFPGRRKQKSGSWVLFSKLGIYIVGFLLAFAAAGIPMDKLAIVIGAISVGIGFGMQNIVNNLVSGIILAVEKPMEVGDVIELGTRVGTVKEIGFRSSQIATYDGSVIIVPNGDFISQQLINWTHSNNNYRRVDVTVGVPYGTDLDKVKDMVFQIVKNHPEVAQFPEPVVLLQDFATNSVNIRCLFWTSDFDKWVGLKSDVLNEIYKAFAKEGIEIPFPQTDLHIKSIDPKAAEVLRKKN